MNWQNFGILAIAVLLACEAPAPPPAKEAQPNPYYAKVEIRGVLIDLSSQPGGGPMAICLPQNQPERPKAQNLPLDVSSLKDWNGKKLLAANYRVVLVTGSLQMQPFTIGDIKTEHLVIVAKNMEVVEDEDAPKKK